MPGIVTRKWIITVGKVVFRLELGLAVCMAGGWCMSSFSYFTTRETEAGSWPATTFSLTLRSLRMHSRSWAGGDSGSQPLLPTGSPERA